MRILRVSVLMSTFYLIKSEFIQILFLNVWLTI